MNVIHPTAVIDPGARLGDDIEVGPHCYIGRRVTLGDGCRLLHNVSVFGRTIVGRRNEFYPSCVIGASPQDLKYKGTETDLLIGDDNVFREQVTIHPGTEVGGGVTSIGHHNRICIGVHIAHDVHMASHCVVTNAVQIAGHCNIEDRCHIGGMSGLQSFVTVGRHAYVAAMSRITVDVPPYLIVHGYDPEVRGVNEKGLKGRWCFTEEQVALLWAAYKILFGRNGKGAISERIAVLEEQAPHDEHVQYLLDSVKRSVLQGVYGRYLESMRRDTAADRREFYEQAARLDGQVDKKSSEEDC
jgi:UDP-N-acetylglucosamine acyltransferase